jgi:hypothetical protein
MTIPSSFVLGQSTALTTSKVAKFGWLTDSVRESSKLLPSRISTESIPPSHNFSPHGHLKHSMNKKNQKNSLIFFKNEKGQKKEQLQKE